MKRSTLLARGFWALAIVWSLALVAGAHALGESNDAAAAAPASPQQTKPAAAPADPQAGYAGSDTCLLCHDQMGPTLTGTPHGQAANPRSPAAAHGCESCHGPGQAHVDDDAKGNILKFGQVRPEQVNESCLGCHNRGTHAGWEGAYTNRGTFHAPPATASTARSRPRTSWR